MRSRQRAGALARPDPGVDRYGRRVVVRRGERKRLPLSRDPRIAYELLAPDLSRKIEFLHVILEPGSGSAEPPSSHPGEEAQLCLEGTYVLVLDGRELAVSEGDSVSFDSGFSHRLENRTAFRARLVIAITPPALVPNVTPI